MKEIVGPVMRCPKGFTLELNPTSSFDLHETTKVVSDRKVGRPLSGPTNNTFWENRTPRGEPYTPRYPAVNRTLDEATGVFDNPSEYRCIGTERKLYNEQDWADIGSRCTPGYHLQNVFETQTNLYEPTKYYICEGYPVLPPEPFCPRGFRPSLNAYNPANFLQEKSISCSRATRFKGRMWCPDTFVLNGEPAPGVPYGGEVEPTTADVNYDPYVYDSVSFTRDTPARCIRWVALHHDQCSDKQCHDPVIKEVAKYVRHFAYYAQKRDPDYIRYMALQGYKDRRWQPKQQQYPQ
ncbi:hypothetical protein GNI_096100 [Gregarina niphandrodes]|uniref:Uncharacterized protein n=1 Tax=Gregarina niphandrodes TaxID=110365 RepID=A0A023B519_GRENI|nr:hypothetical protein GNI_096100 [Gregarina niphandrodes]EZG57969.1 hypothetical protein GNI_096100 [Gregarina niphandrodes]|eukprot:XP_011130998.1 hypothetical protein GNI_096100 [Gregarina niphandrodes]